MSGQAPSDANRATATQLCGYISRIERLEEEIKGLNDDKKDVYGEAKAADFDVSVMKRVVQRRRKDRADVNEEDTMLEFYEGIVNGTLGRARVGQKERDPFD